MIPLRNNPLTNEQIQTAFRAVLTIFAKWQCTTEEAQTLLGIKRSTWFKYKSAPETASFSHDLVERIS